ncbi:MAG: rcc01693 family protein [Pseudomonadota bacterium]
MTDDISGPVDWPRLMRLGLGRLGLPTEAFWAMTPVELTRALEGAGLIPLPGNGPMTRAGLDRLMTAFPDMPPIEEE